MGEVTEHSGEIEGLPVHWLAVEGPGTPTLHLHGVPNASEMWRPFLGPGAALAPDLPGFGRSGKPGHFDYSLDGYVRFLERFLKLCAADTVSLVTHDWGTAFGLGFAQRFPTRVRRMVHIAGVPLLEGYRWHRLARAWRTPVLGELAMGMTSRPVLRLLSREANAAPGPLPAAFIDEILSHFDPGTQRAILRLYRGAPEDTLARAGSELGRVEAPALIVWGQRDPYIPASFAQAYADALPQAQTLVLADAGHWPWLDVPDLPSRVQEFVAGGPDPAS
ncbi:MAG TPA: alpha/beta hydrolase [Solirubrobacteraceae bacterium]|jgi:pimeloyl-ACP methyl ester carboxylesterase|nr:alpha/beta hydrolase [Solirubrobacteraceae bacterium]